MEIGYWSDTGLVRSLNEDSVLCTRFDLKTHLGVLSAGLFAVADGMGGHNAGEVASDLAVRTFHAECLSRLLTHTTISPLSILEAAVVRTNAIVFNTAVQEGLRGMGTTLTAALVIGNNLYVAHIGDSRCYIINARETIQVTKDHSVVQQLVDAGIITAEEAIHHPNRNEITRALGYFRETVPDLYHLKLYAGDHILLCSDGLCGVLPQEKIAQVVLGSSSARQACLDLTAQADLAGGPDNISVIIVKPENLPSWQAVVSAETTLAGKSGGSDVGL